MKKTMTTTDALPAKLGFIRNVRHSKRITPLSVILSEAKNPGSFLALIEVSNAGILLPQGGIRMTGGGLFFYE